MAKKTVEKTEVDKQLDDLFKSASDFAEKAKALEIRVKYEAIKSRGGAASLPSFFDDEEGE